VALSRAVFNGVRFTSSSDILCEDYADNDSLSPLTNCGEMEVDRCSKWSSPLEYFLSTICPFHA
jgi:hypothetical protein